MHPFVVCSLDCSDDEEDFRRYLMYVTDLSCSEWQKGARPQRSVSQSASMTNSAHAQACDADGQYIGDFEVMTELSR